MNRVMKENIETALLDIARVIKRERKRRRYLVGTRVQMGVDVAGVSVDVCERALGCVCVWPLPLLLLLP